MYRCTMQKIQTFNLFFFFLVIVKYDTVPRRRNRACEVERKRKWKKLKKSAHTHIQRATSVPAGFPTVE